MLHKQITADKTGGSAYDALKRVSTEPDGAVDRLILWLTDSKNSEAAKKFAEGFLACVENPDAEEAAGGGDLAVAASAGADLAVEATGGGDLQAGAEEAVQTTQQRSIQKPASSGGSDEGPLGFSLAEAGQSSSHTTDAPAASTSSTVPVASLFDFEFSKLDFNQHEIRTELEVVKAFYQTGSIKDLNTETLTKLPHLDKHALAIYKKMKSEGTLACRNEPPPKNMKKISKNIVSTELADFWQKIRTGKQWKTSRELMTSHDWASVALASFVYRYALT